MGLDNLPKEVRSFITRVLNTADWHDVKVRIVDTPGIIYPGGDIKCNGYFNDDPLEFGIAVGKPLDEWFPIFVHESCHFDQWVEQDPVWMETQVSGNNDSMSLIELWLEHHIELNEDQLNTYTELARAVEVDCEKRSVAKIKKYGFPINAVEYTQKANAYLYFYRIVAETRKWYTVGKEPYNVERIWKQMPTEFVDNYDDIPLDVKCALVDAL